MRYNYKDDKNEFSFLQMPRALKNRKDISPELKYLYMLMYDLTKLSTENLWMDENQDIYIYMGIEVIKEEMGCGNQKAIKLKKDLEKLGLIEDVQMGCNKPNRIYVHKVQ